jgi:putative ABC transport system permease protein
LITELVLLAMLAVPCGLMLGTGFATAILRAVNTETVRVPLILTTSNYAFAVTVVVIASTISAFVVMRKLHQLNLVGALKAPE